MNILVAAFLSLTSPCSDTFTRRGQKFGGAARGRGAAWARWGVSRQRRRARPGRPGEEEPGDAAETRRLTAQENGRVFDVTDGQWQWGRAASLRDQEGWRVNYYTCSQYLTGPTPCPSALHPDSTEGRAKNMAIVSPALNMYSMDRLLRPQEIWSITL